MFFGLLGRMLVRDGQSEVPIKAPKQRVVLAVLLLNHNRIVSLEEIIYAVWGDSPPRLARVTIQNYVKRLRSTLSDFNHSCIVTHLPGYMIRLAPADIDAAQFEERATGAWTAMHGRAWERASAEFRAALSLWRGEVLQDVPSDQLFEHHGRHLAEMRTQAREALIETDLRLGRSSEALLHAEQLLRQNPFRERLHALRMLSMYFAGRRADALAAYQDARGTLIAEIGLEPGASLRSIHQGILTDTVDF